MNYYAATTGAGATAPEQGTMVLGLTAAVLLLLARSFRRAAPRKEFAPNGGGRAQRFVRIR